MGRYNIIYMRRVISLLTAALLMLPSVALAQEQDLPELLIVEIQTGSPDAAGEEFIELANTSQEIIDLTSYRVEYFSAGTTDFSKPSRIVSLRNQLLPGGKYLLASDNYLSDVANDFFAPGLAKTGGHLRLVSSDGADLEKVIDLVGWGTAAFPETASAPAPADGQSLQRKIDEEDKFIDTNNNVDDFSLTNEATPESVGVEVIEEVPEETSTEENPVEATDDTVTDLPPVLNLQISELLPNPAPPATDAEDEYIEIYNPNQGPVNLANYKLQSGTSYNYSFTFTAEHNLNPQGYTTFMVDETDAILANTAGRARLVAPDGQVISETDVYEEANEGLAWALIDNSWQWTTSPTPGGANVFTLPITKVAAAKTTTPKKAAAKPKKAKAAKKTVAKKPKTAAAAARSDYQEPPASTAEATPLHPAVLAGVGLVALVYAAYEYRQDFSNALYRLKRYRAVRRANRQTA